MQILGDGTNLLMIVLGFGLLIAVHELGHFVAARWAGIRVDAFAIGMGPAVLAYRRGIGWKAGSTAGAVQARFGAAPESVPLQTLRDAGVGETEYGLRLLPLGGFVRMKGQEDLTPTEEGGDPDAYGSCVVWKRMIVVSAGVAANLVLAVLLYVAAFMVGVRFESPTVGEIRPGSAASKAVDLDGGPSGLRPGDTIERVSGEPVRTFADVQIAAAMSRAGTPLVLQVRRPGREQPVRFEATPTDESGSGLLSIGFTPTRLRCSSPSWTRPASPRPVWVRAPNSSPSTASPRPRSARCRRRALPASRSRRPGETPTARPAPCPCDRSPSCLAWFPPTAASRKADFWRSCR